MRSLLFAVFVASLVGCASNKNPPHWYNPNATEDQTRRDLENCVELAGEGANPMAKYNSPLFPIFYHYECKREEAIIKRCMEAKGYYSTTNATIYPAMTNTPDSSILWIDGLQHSQTPDWVALAEQPFFGTLTNINSTTASYPKVEVFKDGTAISARFWVQGQPQGKKLNPDPVMIILSTNAPNRSALHGSLSIKAVGWHCDSGAVSFFGMRIVARRLSVDMVTILNDKSRRTSDNITEIFEKQ